MIEKIRETLKGIDKDICQDKDGWWETSTGAEFGAKKLKEIEELVKNCSIPDVSVLSDLIDWCFDNCNASNSDRLHEILDKLDKR